MASVSELSRQVHTDLFPQLWGGGLELRFRLEPFPPTSPLFSVFVSLHLRQAGEIPRASPKIIGV